MSRWRRVLEWQRQAVELGPEQLADVVRRYGSATRLTRPFLAVGDTVDAVVAGVVLLFGNWRLVLLEIVPAVWVGAVLWDWREHGTGRRPIPEVLGDWPGPIAMGVVLATLLAYWCSATIAFALVDASNVRVGAAFRRVREHAVVLTAWAMLVGAAHAYVTVWVSQQRPEWFPVALGAVAVVQVYAVVAVPVALARVPRDRLTLEERIRASVLTAAVTVAATTPGLFVSRAGIVLLDVGRTPLMALAVVVTAVGITLQVAGTSVAHTVILAAKVRRRAMRHAAGAGRPAGGRTSDQG